MIKLTTEERLINKKRCDARYYKNNKRKIQKKNREWYIKNPASKLASRRRLEIKFAISTPSWLTKEQQEEMVQIYVEAFKSKEPCHVDHIVPLNGKNICGLHVPWNLQILTARENQSKGNKLDYESV